MRRLPPVLLASLLLACGDDKGGTDPGSTGDASTGGSTTASSATTTTAATGTTTSVPTTGDASSTADTADSSTGDATTGEPAWCHGWETAAGAPYLALHGIDAAPLVDGGQIQLECGGQGSFMFGLYPNFGGFTPPGDQLSFDVVVDVEGHNTNPEGHFYSATGSGYYVGCDPILGGVLGVVPVIPPDNEEDLLALDGLPADFHVVLHTPNGMVVVDLALTLKATDDGTWRFCGQG